MTMSLITHFNTLQSTLFPLPLHPIYFPYPPLDILGAIRLSIFVTQFTRERNGVLEGESLEAELEKRPGFGQEGVAILVLILGGETFLAALTQQTPSWLLSPSLPLLFLSIHYILSRTRLSRYVPFKPTLAIELPLSLFDALGRSLVLTTFSIDGLVPPAIKVLGPKLDFPSKIKPYPSLYQLLLTPFINTVPFASLTFALDMYHSKGWSLSTPGELKKGGWRAVDCWSPVVVGFVYVWLTGIWGGVEGDGSDGLASRAGAGNGVEHTYESGNRNGTHGVAGVYDGLRGIIINLITQTFGLTGWKISQSVIPESHRLGLTHRYLNYTLNPSTLIGAGTWTRTEARGLCGLIIAFLFASRAIWNFGGWEEWYTHSTRLGTQEQGTILRGVGEVVDEVKAKTKARVRSVKAGVEKRVGDMKTGGMGMGIEMNDLGKKVKEVGKTSVRATGADNMDVKEVKTKARKVKDKVVADTSVSADHVGDVLQETNVTVKDPNISKIEEAPFTEVKSPSKIRKSRAKVAQSP